MCKWFEGQLDGEIERGGWDLDLMDQDEIFQDYEETVDDIMEKIVTP